jgi:hypothetical protein
MKFVILLFILFISFVQCAQLKSQVVDSVQKRILLTEVALGDNITNVSTKKIEIAFTTACLLSKEYEPLLPKEIVKELRQKNLPYSNLKEITQNLSQVNVSYVSQLSILRLGNVLRISMKVDNVNDTLPAQTGIGYSLLNYRVSNAKDSILYDVALLEGIQKALAIAVKKPKLFASLEGKLQVIPSSPLIIGGIAFFGNDSFPKWDLFKEKTAVSYDAVASMFLEMKDNKNFTTYDIDSRDSLFAMFHLYGLENYQAPTVQEIKAMYANEVTHYITGTFVRTAEGADLQLILCYVNGKTTKLNALYSSKASIKNDSKLEFKDILIKTLRDLLRQYPSLLDSKN